MAFTIEATYENGVLKPVHPLPLPFKEHERVQVTIPAQPAEIVQAYGIMGYSGDAETLHRIALDPEFLPD